MTGNELREIRAVIVTHTSLFSRYHGFFSFVLFPASGVSIASVPGVLSNDSFDPQKKQGYDMDYRFTF